MAAPAINEACGSQRGLKGSMVAPLPWIEETGETGDHSLTGWLHWLTESLVTKECDDLFLPSEGRERERGSQLVEGLVNWLTSFEETLPISADKETPINVGWLCPPASPIYVCALGNVGQGKRHASRWQD